ncbi:MAG: Gfo/Idh/MocA family oxidoreductase [Spirochaetales bacterium]|nr:Gfo/Idh/MocA family oxidoreductase [Spirochaetales bacterium]
MDKQNIRWGILATGGIARLQTADLITNGSRVEAVGSRSLSSAEKFGDEFNIPYRYGSYEELCDSPEVDVIYIATPHTFHYENAMMALEKGKHLLVEKAFTINSRQAEEIINLAQKKNLFVMEAMWTRFLPSMQRIKEIVSSGGIGELRLILADHDQYIPMEKARRLHDPALGGGALLDLGIYVISLADFMLGEPEKMSVEGTMTDLGVDEMTAMLFRYANGAQAVLHCGFMTPGSNKAVLVGTKGRIEIDPVWYTQTSFTHLDADGRVIERYEDTIKGRGMQYQAQEVESCLAAGKTDSSVMPLAGTLSIMKTMDRIRDEINLVYPEEKE